MYAPPRYSSRNHNADLACDGQNGWRTESLDFLKQKFHLMLCLIGDQGNGQIRLGYAVNK